MTKSQFQIMTVTAQQVKVGDIVMVGNGEPLTVVSVSEGKGAYADSFAIGLVGEGSGYTAVSWYRGDYAFLSKRFSVIGD